MALRTASALLITAALFTACSSEPTPLVVGSDTGNTASDGSTADSTVATPERVRAVADDSAPIIIGLTEMRSDTVVGNPRSAEELASLGGTAWALFDYDGTFFEAGAVSLAVTDGFLEFTYVDECASGTATMTSEMVRGRWILHNDAEADPACAGFPSSIFHDQAEVELHQRSGELVIESTGGYLRAQHLKSAPNRETVINVALHELPKTERPVLPAPNLETPVVDSLAEVNTVVDLPFMTCPSSGRRGIDPNPILREGIVWSEAIGDHFADLPYVVGLSGGASLYHHEVGVDISVRYKPTLTWLAENVPPDVICLSAPPLGHYSAEVPDLSWSLADEPSSTATTVQVTGTSCALDRTEPEVSYRDTEIEIRFRGTQRQYGMDVGEPACEPTVTVQLNEPVGSRAIVPKFTN